jgi:outer membrane protein assembly factor BamB
MRSFVLTGVLVLAAACKGDAGTDEGASSTDDGEETTEGGDPLCPVESPPDPDACGWESVHDEAGGWSSVDVDVGPDGSVYALSSDSLQGQTWLRKIAVNGETVWTLARPGRPRAVATHPSGRVHVLEATPEGVEMLYGLAPNGDEVWSIDLSSEFDTARDLAVSLCSGVYVLGAGPPDCEGWPCELRLARYDEMGDLAWSVNHAGPPRAEPRDIVVDADDSLVLAGAVGDAPWLAKYDAQGSETWALELGPVGGNADAVAVDANRAIFLLRSPQLRSQLELDRYEADGTLTWSVDVSAAAGEVFGYDVVADGLGTVYAASAAGTTAFLGTYAAADGTGAQQAASPYSFLSALAVDPWDNLVLNGSVGAAVSMRTVRVACDG